LLSSTSSMEFSKICSVLPSHERIEREEL
jgi:hypothetical protein